MYVVRLIQNLPSVLQSSSYLIIIPINEYRVTPIMDVCAWCMFGWPRPTTQWIPYSTFCNGDKKIATKLMLNFEESDSGSV